jgi:hypothetical protein
MVAVEPETCMYGPATTALEYPIDSSQGPPEEIVLSADTSVRNVRGCVQTQNQQHRLAPMAPR